MSELINNTEKRKTRLKDLILKLHAGATGHQTKRRTDANTKQYPL